jgi:acylphosphatase
MKTEIKITGDKVHNVGYRYFLMIHAMNLGIQKFHAYNFNEGGCQIVIATAEGSDNQIAAYTEFVTNNMPSGAVISKVSSSDYEGEIMRLSEFAMICTFVQMNKAIPLLLKIEDNTNSLIGCQKTLIDGQKSLKEGQKILIDGQNEMIDEICGLRRDIVSGSDDQLIRIEKDIRAIKNKIKII